MAKSILEVNGLNKFYSKIHAVKDLNLTVNKGEIFGILGPNGAGKSTTLECILGTKKSDQGEVKILGLDPVSDRRRVFEHVGVQFQDSSWQGGIKTGELCESVACLYNPIPQWKNLLKKFDLEKRRKSPVSSLSGGERQKLSILLAFIPQPDVIFLDELTTGLDPIARRETWNFIKELRERGATIILTSHFMDEVEFLCNRGTILKEGRAIAEGTVEELIDMGKGKSLDEAYVNILGGEAV